MLRNSSPEKIVVPSNGYIFKGETVKLPSADPDFWSQMYQHLWPAMAQDGAIDFDEFCALVNA